MGILQRFFSRCKQKEKLEPKPEKQIDFKHMTLMYKNEPVLDLEFSALGLSAVSNLRDINKLPYGVINPRNQQDGVDINYNALKTYLGAWLEYRIIPDSRPNIKELLDKCNLQTTTELTCRSLGLSFADSFWFKPQNLEIAWEEVNLYQNGFSQDIGDILFDPTTEKFHISYISPDPTTRGEDAKRWIEENGQAYLVKTNEKLEQVAYNELVAAKIGERLKLRCAEYQVFKGDITMMENGIPIKKDCTFAKSKNFCRPDRIYLPADYLRIIVETNNAKDLIDLIKIKEPAVYKEFQKMLVLDFIINNEDRHAENFGFEIDEYGNLYFGCVFDNGNSLNHESSEFVSATSDNKCKFHGYASNEGMMYLYFKYKDELDFFDAENFKGLKDEIINIYRQSSMSEEKIQKIAQFIEDRIQEVQQLKDRLPERIIIKDEKENEER